MQSFEKIKTICEETSSISSVVIDEFLLYYAAAQNNLERVMNRRFARYSHVTEEFKKEWINMLKAQYIVHEIFREGGMIKKLLNHSALQNLLKKEREFLEKQSERPWRFSFSVIADRPAEEFFTMVDVFDGYEYLLYSPGISKIIHEQGMRVWFNLIGYNGACWQSYGPIGAYKSFDPDDIYFFATEVNPEIEYDEDVLADVERDPLPYMMLLSGSEYPVTVHKEDEIVITMAEYDLDKLDTMSLSQSFKREYNAGVYRLSLKRKGGPPHFSQAYYDENEKIILLSAMTDRGFQALVNNINKYGFHFSEEPFIRVHPAMLIVTEKILKRKITLNKYEELFSIDSSEEEKEEMEKLNNFLHMAMDAINEGGEPDIEALARKTGVDVETARDLFRQVMKKFKDMDKK